MNLPRPRKRFGQHFLVDSDVIERIVALHPDDLITDRDLNIGEGQTTEGRRGLLDEPSYAKAKERFETAYFQELLNKSEGDLHRAARLSGIHKATI